MRKSIRFGPMALLIVPLGGGGCKRLSDCSPRFHRGSHPETSKPSVISRWSSDAELASRRRQPVGPDPFGSCPKITCKTQRCGCAKYRVYAGSGNVFQARRRAPEPRPDSGTRTAARRPFWRLKIGAKYQVPDCARADGGQGGILGFWRPGVPEPLVVGPSLGENCRRVKESKDRSAPRGESLPG